MRIFDCCQLMLIVFNPINYSYLMTSHNNRIMKKYKNRTTQVMIHSVVVIDNSFELAKALGLSSGIFTTVLLSSTYHQSKNLIDHKISLNYFTKISIVISLLVSIFLSVYAYIKTDSVRFQFSNEDMSIVQKDGSSIGDNPLFGSEYQWKYSQIVNYCFLPSDNSPVLFYFKEEKTPFAKRIDPPIIIDDINGQTHFFPIIMNTQQLTNQLNIFNIPKASCTNIKLQEDPITFINGLKLL